MQTPLHTAEFRYRGHASAVRLQTFMPRFSSPLDFTGEGDEWKLDLELPIDTRMEYRLEVVEGHHSRSILDPGNPSSADNPFGTNSVYMGPAYRGVHWPSGGSTTEVRVQSTSLGGRRHHILHSPVGIDNDTPLPLLIAHDGSDYVRYAGLLTCIAALHAANAIPAVRVLGLNPRERAIHYIGSERHAHHVVQEVIPHVSARVAIGDAIVLMGASLGAVAAWHTAWLSPGTFAGLFLQSGTFALEPHPELSPPMFESINRFVEAAIDAPATHDVRVAQTCGRWESLIDWNRTVAESLASHSRHHVYRETWTGHDWGAWSGTLQFGLLRTLGHRDRAQQATVEHP